MTMQRGIAKVTIGKNNKKYYYEQLNPDATYSYWYRILEYHFICHIEQSKVGKVNEVKYNENNEIIFIDYLYEIEAFDVLTMLKYGRSNLFKTDNFGKK